MSVVFFLGKKYIRVYILLNCVATTQIVTISNWLTRDYCYLYPREKNIYKAIQKNTSKIYFIYNQIILIDTQPQMIYNWVDYLLICLI